MSADRSVVQSGNSTPVLWHFPISHFNEKVRWALDWKRIPHVRQALAIGYMPRAWWATGQAKLPILFLDGAAIADSTRIIEALERRSPEPPLYPSDASERRRALALEDFFDEEVGSPVRTTILAPLFANDPAAAIGALSVGMGAGARRTMRAIFPAFRVLYRSRHGMSDAAIAAAPGIVRAAFDRIATEVGRSGYLVGDRFSVADLAAAALLAPIVVPPEHPHRPPEPLPPTFRAFRDSVAGHAGFRWVMEMYRRHRGTSAEVSALTQR
ncbi:MAG: glutathione S-transferase [Deltaproteobacteria bacterium]|nr:glutathione S-transferase [Deltaproteobacteria bacterium]